MKKLTVELPDEVVERLKRYAGENDVTLKQLMAYVLSDYSPPRDPEEDDLGD